MKGEVADDHYASLGLAKNASLEEIKAAFRRAAKKHHPDVSSDAGSVDQFQRASEAYRVLSDPSLRREFDALRGTADNRDKAANDLAPLRCDCCASICAKPRFTIHLQVVSFLVLTRRKPKAAIYCSDCAGKKSLQASIMTWLFGWWAFPWGPIYSLNALFVNGVGGRQPPEINVAVSVRQTLAFLAMQRKDLARTTALQAIWFARKLGAKQEEKVRSDLQPFFDGDQLLRQTGRRSDRWGFWGKFTLAHASIAIIVSLTIAATLERSFSDSRVAPSIRSASAATSSAAGQAIRKPAYVRPLTTPEGEPWPTAPGYVGVTDRSSERGLSNVTVDNTRNPSDVLVKLVSLNGVEPSAVRMFYIPGHQRFTIGNVTMGQYDIRYRDLDSGGLSRTEPFRLDERLVQNGREFSNVTMTLYKVQNGNMRTVAIPESDF